MPAADVLPQVQISDEEVTARIAAINARFDADRPFRLRIRVKSYGKGRVSIAVSNGGQPAQRTLVQVNTASMKAEEMHDAVNARIGATIEEIYSADVANGFPENTVVPCWRRGVPSVRWMQHHRFGCRKSNQCGRKWGFP
jgi:hypothetical protein